MGRIDHAGHSNLVKSVSTNHRIDEVIKVAMDFAEEDGNTLAIVTADHETGGLQKDGNTYKFNSGDHTGVNVPVLQWGKVPKLQVYI